VVIVGAGDGRGVAVGRGTGVEERTATGVAGGDAVGMGGGAAHAASIRRISASRRWGDFIVLCRIAEV